MPFGVNKRTRHGSYLPTFDFMFGLGVMAGSQSVGKVSGLLERQPMADSHGFARACLHESVRHESADNLKRTSQASEVKV